MQQKQKYLRQNILEKEYDAQEFMDFCESYKGSININLWTLAQLQQIVDQFIKHSNKGLEEDPFQQKTSPSYQIDIDWDKAFDHSHKPQPSPANVNLNLIDLDFLEGMGGSSPTVHKQQKKVEPVCKPAPQVQKKSSDPSEILAKLNDKNNNQFISAYNAFAINSREKQEQKEKQPKQEAPPSKKQIKATSPPQELVIPVPKDNNSTQEQCFKTIIKCRTFANKAKLDQDYQITVTGHQVINPNPFVPNYVLYSITTNPLGVQVKRRLKDFQTFRNLLRKMFPGMQIPYLERYGRRLSETEPATIRKQKLFLQSFLNGVMMNRQIRCKIVDEFFLCENLDTLKKIFRDFQKLDKPKGIQDIYTQAGKAQVNYNADSKKYVSQQQLYFDYLQVNFSKLKELYDQLSLSFASSVKIMNEISDLYDNLRDSTKNVNNLLHQPLRSSFLQTTFDKISDLHKHWSLSFKTQAKVLEVEVRHICRYEMSNIETIREITKICDSFLETYSKRNDKLEASREQYEFNKRLNDYKSGVESTSKSTAVLRYQTGFYLQSTRRQVRRYLRQLSDKLQRKFKIFSGLQLNICSDLQNNWRQFQTFVKINNK